MHEIRLLLNAGEKWGRRQGRRRRRERGGSQYREDS
jgi:hypothetical protein